MHDKEKGIVVVQKLNVKQECSNFFSFKYTNEKAFVSIENAKKCIKYDLGAKNFLTIINYYLVVD